MSLVDPGGVPHNGTQSHLLSPKSTHVGRRCPQRGWRPPQREILDPSLQVQEFSFFVQLFPVLSIHNIQMRKFTIFVASDVLQTQTQTEAP